MQVSPAAFTKDSRPVPMRATTLPIYCCSQEISETKVEQKGPETVKKLIAESIRPGIASYLGVYIYKILESDVKHLAEYFTENRGGKIPENLEEIVRIRMNALFSDIVVEESIAASRDIDEDGPFPETNLAESIGYSEREFSNWLFNTVLLLETNDVCLRSNMSEKEASIAINTHLIAASVFHIMLECWVQLDDKVASLAGLLFDKVQTSDAVIDGYGVIAVFGRSLIANNPLAFLENDDCQYL